MSFKNKFLDQISSPRRSASRFNITPSRQSRAINPTQHIVPNEKRNNKSTQHIVPNEKRNNKPTQHIVPNEKRTIIELDAISEKNLKIDEFFITDYHELIYIAKPPLTDDDIFLFIDGTNAKDVVTFNNLNLT